MVASALPVILFRSPTKDGAEPLKIQVKRGLGQSGQVPERRIGQDGFVEGLFFASGGPGDAPGGDGSRESSMPLQPFHFIGNSNEKRVI